MATEEKVNEGVGDNDPVPYFKIGANTFHTGIGSFEPGTVIPWSVPEGWKTKENGRHYASHGPSLTWEPLNKAARKVMEAHVALVKERNKPKPDPAAERMVKLEEAFNRQAEASQKQTEVLTALLTELVGKKK